MATLVLSAAGAALGAGFGGTVLGLSGAVIGRAIGATLGRAIDQRLLGGGADAVQVGRIDRLRLTGAGEGMPITHLWGRMRVAGQVIWTEGFREHSSTSRAGGKGGGPKVTSYSYSTSLAIALCAGPVLRLGRIWADGEEIDAASLNLRLYPGTEEQLPDPKLEAALGMGRVPGFRGIAWVMIEDLNLSAHGNRVPQFTFEVIRAADGGPEEPGLQDVVRAVALIPGTGEYALATTPVREGGLAAIFRPPAPLNRNNSGRRTDFAESLAQLGEELPNCGSVSLVVSWFGDDLRAGECRIRPKVERRLRDGLEMPWRAGGISREDAQEVPKREGRVIYGGTPADAAVIEAIRAIRAEGREVMFYPFILMEQLQGNTLPDPWTGETGQPALPWRGRITTALAPGRAGSSDGTAAAEAEVAAFFGTALPSHFTSSGGVVNYAGPAEWRYRRFILHYARLCAAAGGVDAFCIGSEMVSLTRIRGAGNSFPAVQALRVLAAEVKAILGPDCAVSYAADWTEYGSHQVAGDLHFPLDPLWSDPNIDFIGIDNYMPLADWRQGEGHADAGFESGHDLDYLKGNVAGGEYFDWYYDSPEGEAAQKRLPIADGAYGEDWIFRVKDLRGWWENTHHPRTSGVRAAEPGPWVPCAKPIRFTEYGCAAVDCGANQPNRFLDPHSSESALPRASSGARDDLIQMQYLRAMAAHWRDPAKNPVSHLYDGRMVDFDRAHVWAWDARPWPDFPGRAELWSDAGNWARGHWLNGRAANQPLGAVLREICRLSGLEDVVTARAPGLVRGYAHDMGQSARAALQPLLLAHGLDAVARGERLEFRARRAGADLAPQAGRLAVTEGLEGRAEISRLAEAEVCGTLRLTHIDAEGAQDARVAEARLPDEAQKSIASSELPLALLAGEGQALAHRWLAEARIARDRLRLALPPSLGEVLPGDRLRLEDGSTWRIDRTEQAGARLIEATRFEAGLHRGPWPEGGESVTAPRPLPVPVLPVFLDLPLLTGDEVPHQPHLAAFARPWPGQVGLWSASDGADFALERALASPAAIGETLDPLPSGAVALWDRGPAIRLRMEHGELQSASMAAVLNGANAVAIGDGSPGNWEVLQFTEAELVGPQTWAISMRLRGQLGTDALMPEEWPAGSMVVALTPALVQTGLTAAQRGVLRRYRVGALSRGHDDALAEERSLAFDGNGLRPYRVAHLRATGGPGEEIRLRWIRRTRIEGDSWEALDVPLGEEAESYLLRIRAPGGALLAEHFSPVQAFIYDAARQAADGAGEAFVIEVGQISARFGPGPFRRLSFGI